MTLKKFENWKTGYTPADHGSQASREDDQKRDFKKSDTYKKYFYMTLECFLNDLPNDGVWESYINEEDGHIELQDFINMNLKEKFQWSTGIGIMEACESIVEEAYSNGNIK